MPITIYGIKNMRHDEKGEMRRALYFVIISSFCAPL